MGIYEWNRSFLVMLFLYVYEIFEMIIFKLEIGGYGFLKKIGLGIYIYIYICWVDWCFVKIFCIYGDIIRI